jgi:hypothetical protein
MGGSFAPVAADNAFAAEYANTPRREFNFRWDPEATAIVLREPWRSITQVPVDPTTKTYFRRELFDEIAKAGAAAREAAFAKFGGAVQGGVRLPPAPPPAAGMPYAVGDSVLVPRSDGSVSPAVIVEIVAEKGLATVEIVGSGSSPLRKRVSMASLKPHEKPADDAAYEDKDDYY